MVGGKIKSLAAGLTALGAGLAAAGGAWGSGFQLRENSAAALGNAFAGAAASTEDPSVIANNPAAMIGLSGNQVSGDHDHRHSVGGIFRIGAHAPRDSRSAEAMAAMRAAPSPSPRLYGFYDAAPDLKFGLALTAPFGLRSQYDSGWVGRYQAIKSDIETININPECRLPGTRLAFGRGRAGNTACARRIYQRDQCHYRGAARQSVAAGRIYPAGRHVRVTGDLWSVGYDLGVLVEISPETRLGASYRSQISHRIEGTATFERSGPASSQSRSFKAARARADLKTPDIVSLAAIPPDRAGR